VNLVFIKLNIKNPLLFKKMRFQNILATTLCFIGFAAADKCNGRFRTVELTTVNSIANEINVNSCIAGDVLVYMKEAHKFNVRKGLTLNECKIGCKNEAAKLNVEPSVVDELINICEGKCILESIEPNYVEPDGDIVNIEKRASCDSISKANVVVTNSNYRNGYKQYQDKGSVKTALSEVNGCGPKQAVLGIDNETLKLIPGILDGTFEPACNMHDICYACQKGKSTCDTRFKNGMINICNKEFPSSSNAIKNAGCKVQAELFYQAVNLGGNGAYNGSSVNSSSSCAACGVSVMSTLISTPFYKK